MGNSSGIISIGHSHELEVHSGECWEVTLQSVQILNLKNERLPVVKQVTFHIQNQVHFKVFRFSLFSLEIAKFKKVNWQNEVPGRRIIAGVFTLKSV